MSNRKNDRRRKARSYLTRRLLLQYFVTVVGFAAALVLLVFLGLWICLQINWDYYDPLYRFLIWVSENIFLLGSMVFLLGWVVITCLFMARPMRYLNEIVWASEQLAEPTEEQITLPSAMQSIQDEMNLIRERSLRNDMLAREAEQRKNDLVVYLAHDLKTPLTSVIGYLTLLRDEPQLSPELRARYTNIALSKAERLEYLVNEFFEITRFNLTNLTLAPERVNLSRMLEQVTYEFNPLLNEKDLSWNLHLEPDVELLCDADKLERVFDNLIRNAVNYSYAGTEILVSLETLENEVQVRVQNRGKTIPPEKLERIFDQFFRLDSSRGSSNGGVGLGLAIAREIVELHGGTISAESAGESIVFLVRFPKTSEKRMNLS